MPVSKHLDEAAAKLNDALLRIDEARVGQATPDHQQRWLEALTECCRALAEIQSYNNESVHEKLHLLAGKIGLRKFP